MKHVTPSIKETAFNCPHCAALTSQTWFAVRCDQLKDNETPHVETPDSLKAFLETDDGRKMPKSIAETFRRLAGGRPFLDPGRADGDHYLHNVSVSQCFNCDDIAIWIYDHLVWPQPGDGPAANEDLPADVRGDYDEASAILDRSPRGAAALLRLAIQKLCKHLGGKGENLNDDIGELVAKGRLAQEPVGA